MRYVSSKTRRSTVYILLPRVCVLILIIVYGIISRSSYIYPHIRNDFPRGELEIGYFRGISLPELFFWGFQRTWSLHTGFFIVR